MIRSIRLKFGHAPGLAAEEIAATPVVIFVGPNNSGKSKVLAEIQQFCTNGQQDAGAKLLADLTFSPMVEESIPTAVSHVRLEPNRDEAVPIGHIVVGSRGSRQHVPNDGLRQLLGDPSKNVSAFCQWFLRYSTLMLDGKSRISLVDQQKAGDLQRPQTSLQLLFASDDKRREVRRILFEAFGSHFVIDPTNLSHLRVRLSDKAPTDEREERGIHKEAVDFHGHALPVEAASDGVKAFTGIITEVVAGDPKVVLIDEPEAFLHPSLAFNLGKELSRAALSSDKRVFVSTHSPNFVMGCIQSGAPITIVRLTYRDRVPTARVLPSEEILQLMRNPLLRSTGVLGGLFSEFVVVTEGDADRAFYQEVNERLQRLQPPRGIPNCLFLNAQNWQTIRTIVGPLRKLGIPAAGVVDVDVLNTGGIPWTGLLAAAFVPEISAAAMSTTRAAVRRAVEATGRDMKLDGGIAVLGIADREAAENLLRDLLRYGLFVVPGGELESWLKELDVHGHGPGWLIAMFEKMGEDPNSPDYVHPTEGDVWAFLAKVKAWVLDPARQGIPS